MSYLCDLLCKKFVWVLGNKLLLAVCAEILVQLCADLAAMCAGWEGNCKERLMNEWIRRIIRLESVSIIEWLVGNYYVTHFLSLHCEGLYIEWLDLFCSGYILLRKSVYWSKSRFVLFGLCNVVLMLWKKYNCRSSARGWNWIHIWPCAETR